MKQYETRPKRQRFCNISPACGLGTSARLFVAGFMRHMLQASQASSARDSLHLFRKDTSEEAAEPLSRRLPKSLNDFLIVITSQRAKVDQFWSITGIRVRHMSSKRETRYQAQRRNLR